MQKIRNESGITLIEVLATLTIMSLLTGVVYGVFINGLNYSSQAKDTVAIQQEANYVLTVLKEQQENNYAYTVSVSPDNKTVTITSKKNQQSEEMIIENPLFHYEICQIDDNTDQCMPNPDSNNPNPPAININNTNKESLHVKIVITKVNSNLKYKIQTILSRL